MQLKVSDDKLLLGSLLIVAVCALTYELLIGTIASYFMGSSVLHFSLTTGAFLFFTGIGSYLSRLVKEQRILETFIGLEVLLGIIGGISGLLLFFAFAHTEYFYFVAFFLLALSGTIAGLEVPLLTRILSARGALKDILASVFAIDYLGAVIASVFFPLVLLPVLGAMRVALVMGALNLSVALVVIVFLRADVKARFYKFLFCVISLCFLGGLFAFSHPIKAMIEQTLFQDTILLSKESAYQQIVLTGHRDDVRLYLNGDLQFSSVDEYRYHEPLVHIPMGMMDRPHTILLLGAGDGLAVREILKHRSVESITVVDLDPEVVKIASEHPLIRQLNLGALSDPKVSVVQQDAFSFLMHNTKLYDLVIIDLPDPNDENLGRLYTKEFYQMVHRALTPSGMMLTQAGSPYFTNEAFWSIGATLKEVFAHTLPLQANVPSFGIWGFQIASDIPIPYEKIRLPEGLRYLTPTVLPTLKIFEPDVAEPMTGLGVSTLDNLYVIHAYRRGREEFE